MPITPVSSETLPLAAAQATAEVDTQLWAIVFAGGIGTRFWPLSSRRRPKPALQLVSERSLIAETLHRIEPLVPAERVLVVTARDIATAVRDAVPELPADNILVEPRPLGTAAAMAWALSVIRARGGEHAMTCAMHSDLTAAFPDQFRGALQRAAMLAQRERSIVTLGVHPTRAEMAFGYAVPGDPVDAANPVSRGGACKVRRFVEKPGLDVLAGLLDEGALWHSGVLVGSMRVLHNELFAHATEIMPGHEALANGNLPVFAGMVRQISIEHGLLERTTNIIVVPVDCGWDDVGTWESLRRARDLDDDGNGAIGEAHFVDSTGNVVHSESGPVVLYGCQQMLVVTLDGITFVTPIERAAELRPLLDQLPPHLKSDPSRPRT